MFAQECNGSYLGSVIFNYIGIISCHCLEDKIGATVNGMRDFFFV